ncbi:MAG: helix-turn-helix domain-containing protein [Bacteroidales bacterium]|nr:helix-turn-helix domain-containing protein [Bacteroidales bacterium]MCI2122219.1 helix-turn-helix domain-containing protein [Bacteroidales bacterium]MCI2145555.1 helix-turn-helix domain-containing protein [Bacteroidales bacterium]
MFRIIDDVMKSGKLFLDPELCLNRIAAESGMNRTYVSQTLGKYAKGYYSYVNEYRLRYAFEILTDVSRMPVTLTELASCSGFSDERAMNKYCLKAYGITASHYFSRRKVSH